jgi:hypothetical protein
MLSWIMSEIDIILLVETWEHEESKVPNIEGFFLWQYRTRDRGIDCYIKNNIFSHIKIHNKHPFNQHIWMDILDINANKIHIEICSFVPINSTFYKKNSLDKNCSYNGLEHDIYILRNDILSLMYCH